MISAKPGAYDRRTRRVVTAGTHVNEVGLGGTMVGKRDDVPTPYLEHIIKHLREATAKPALKMADDLFDALQNPDTILALFGKLELLARSLIKICRDLRLLCSGPEGGFAEVVLPAVLSGSSVMPGKINPVIPEFVMQCSFQALGHYHSAAIALDQGELHLNIWEGLVITNFLDAHELLTQAMRQLDSQCFAGLQLNKETCERHAGALSATIMEAKKKFGYEKVSHALADARRQGRDVKHALKDSAFGSKA